MKEEIKEKLNATANKLFKGDLTLKKMDLWLIGAVCLLVGIIYGLKKAPWTHGVMIGSNNGSNHQYNNAGVPSLNEDEEAQGEKDKE